MSVSQCLWMLCCVRWGQELVSESVVKTSPVWMENCSLSPNPKPPFVHGSIQVKGFVEEEEIRALVEGQFLAKRVHAEKLGYKISEYSGLARVLVWFPRSILILYAVYGSPSSIVNWSALFTKYIPCLSLPTFLCYIHLLFIPPRPHTHTHTLCFLCSLYWSFLFSPKRLAYLRRWSSAFALLSAATTPALLFLCFPPRDFSHKYHQKYPNQANLLTPPPRTNPIPISLSPEFVSSLKCFFFL